MALATSEKREGLIVANTSNVKEMKNGRPMNVQIPADATGAQLANCMIVKLGETLQGTVGTDGYNGELDHVYEVEVATSITRAEIEAGLVYVVVAPEIMVEEARKTDGHIGLFRFVPGDVHTAYQLSMHDRLEVSANHHALGLGAKVISKRPMAQGLILQPNGAVYDGAELEMTKIEFAPAQA